MTIGTDRAMMGDLEIGVIEYRPQPGGGHVSRVAGNASRWIIRGHMVWCGPAIGLCVRVVSGMAAVAVRRRVARRVVPSDVAIRAGVDHRPDGAGDRRAWRQHVRSLQWEARRGVVEFAVYPEQGVMAGRAQ